MPTPLWMDNLRVNREIFDMDKSITYLPHREQNWRGAVVIGTGPSLEKNVADLKDRPKDILLVACETAAPFLFEKGVIPDIVMTAEEQEVIALLFHRLKGWYPSVALVASTTANSFGMYLAQKHGAEIFFYNSAHPMLVQDGRYQFGKLPKRVPSLTSQCGSILFHGVALARWLGISDIALVGADFGVDVQKNSSMPLKTHAGTYHVEGIPVDCINQSFEWHQAELESRRVRRLRIVNCTEGGRLELYPKQTIKEWLVQIVETQPEQINAPRLVDNP